MNILRVIYLQYSARGFMYTLSSYYNTDTMQCVYSLCIYQATSSITAGLVLVVMILINVFHVAFMYLPDINTCLTQYCVRILANLRDIK